MKKAMILGLLAALTITGNTLALNTRRSRDVVLDGVYPAGRLVFDPHAHNLAPTPRAPLGSCLYQGAWYSAANVGTAMSCAIVEQKQGGHLSCFDNARVDFASTAVAVAAHCGGFDENGDAFESGEGGVTMALAELPGLGLIGTVTYDGLSPEPIQINGRERRSQPVLPLK
jgi:hypothetical protein